MKIVQTLWTRPGLKAGWIDRRFNFFSWALSCLQLRKFYDSVELYTDSFGKELLVDTFGLPYSKVHVVLDDFNYPSHLWAASKIRTYSLQDGPFLHVDGDVYIFHPFNSSKITQDLVYQNREVEMFEGAFYTSNVKQLYAAADGRDMPQWLQDLKIDRIEALNAGVLGGSDLAFFHDLARTAFDFYDNYPHLINAMEHPEHANHISEQVLAGHLLYQRNVSNHTGLFETNYFMTPDTMHLVNNMPTVEDPHIETSASPVPFGYQALNYFGISPHGRKYVHMMGFNKRTGLTCRLLGRRLKADYPEYYHRIMDYYRSSTGKPATLHCFQEKMTTLTVSGTFKKTLYFYQHMTGQPLPTNMPLERFIATYPRLVEQLEDKKTVERLLSLFDFERQRHAYALELTDPGVWAQMEAAAAAPPDKIYSAEQPGLEALQLSVNPLVRYLPMSWNWTHGSAFTHAHPPEEQAVIALMAEEVTGSILELDLTIYNQLLYQLFVTKRSYAGGMTAFATAIDGLSDTALRTVYFQCIVYLVTNNILLVH